MAMASNIIFMIEELVRAKVREEITKICRNAGERCLPNIIADMKHHMEEIPEICPLDLSLPKSESHVINMKPEIHPLDMSNHSETKHNVTLDSSSFNERKDSCFTLFKTEGNPPAKLVSDTELIMLNSADDDAEKAPVQISVREIASLASTSLQRETIPALITKPSAVKEETTSNYEAQRIEHDYSLSTEAQNNSNHHQPDEAAASEGRDLVSNHFKTSTTKQNTSSALIKIRKRDIPKTTATLKSKPSKPSKIRRNILKIYSCKTCGKFFSSFRSLSCHTGIHIRDSAHTCDVCWEKHVYYQNNQRRQRSSCMSHCSTCYAISSRGQN